MNWTSNATMRYLNDFPLPRWLCWPHRDGGEQPVRPSHEKVIGFGKWLRETPYFPGLFELIDDLLDAEPDELGGSEWLARKLTELRAKHEKNLTPSPRPLAHRLRPFAGQTTVQPTLEL
jgi:hypothetical protein